MVKKVKIGIIGCAKVAEKHAIPAFKAIDNAELVSIASRDKNKAKEWSLKYKIGYEDSYDSLLERDDIDAVYIPLPIGLHEEFALKAAKARKHIICEKSLSDNFNSVKNIVYYCKSHGLVLYENFMCDFHPQHKEVLSLIKKGVIGNPFAFKGYFGFPPVEEKSFRYNKSLGGGSLNDAGAYTVFMARKIFGEPIAVTCNLFFDTKKNIDIRGSAYLEFSQGRIGFVAFGFNNVYQNNYSIWGEKGLVNVNRAFSIPANVKPNVEILKNEYSKDYISLVDIPAANQFELIFQDFCDTVINNKKEKIKRSYFQALSQGRVLEAMRMSAGKGRKIKISEVK